jgi:hypothetical protein
MSPKTVTTKATAATGGSVTSRGATVQMCHKKPVVKVGPPRRYRGVL